MHDDMWAYRSGIVHPTGEDITGYTVAAADGTIGKVDKHSADVSDAYLVVDTGPWIFGREVLIPAGTVTRIDEAAHTVHVDLSKDQVKDSPEFHRDRHLGDPDYRLAMSDYYGATGTGR
ncbi:PRC-barrel domain containing protein [Streptomyces sp. NPDC048507]|uniref:PRC-barrel domain containing protein n=1 Tax=Streptomyces sp. NPDC048507 TaxID=3365560 RepID=UPI00371E4BF6